MMMSRIVSMVTSWFAVELACRCSASANQNGRAVVGDVCAVFDLDECAVEAVVGDAHDGAEARAGRRCAFDPRAALVHGAVAGLQELKADFCTDLGRRDRAV